ncbi:ABC transporter ATP-binding protein [Aquamicrobium segne]|uniref:ABC transporter ATP-binding protein n=1 Tax=Aquamicrobium segne TaxID=469547 RepID=A0ABW0GYE9_9HYPH
MTQQLQINNVTKRFGGLRIIEGFDLELQAGARHAIIGPNGAGKTTLFNMISGWLVPTSGNISIDGKNIAGMSPEKVTEAGLARSFQKNTLFEGLSVLESLRLSIQARSRARFNFLAAASSFKDIIEQACIAAEKMNLQDVLDRQVKTLSYGQKRQLEVAMALACSPKILLLDEPAAGTSPAERTLLMQLLNELPKEMTLLLVEHDMDVVFGVCSQITVLNYGRAVVTGTPEEIRQNEDVRAAYLGKSLDQDGGRHE